MGATVINDVLETLGARWIRHPSDYRPRERAAELHLFVKDDHDPAITAAAGELERALRDGDSHQAAIPVWPQAHGHLSRYAELGKARGLAQFSVIDARLTSP